MCALVLADLTRKLRILDVAIKNKAFQLIGVYGPNAISELPDFFRSRVPYVTSSRWVILVGDWNAFLDPNLIDGVLVQVLKTWMLGTFASLSNDVTLSTSFVRDIQIS